MQANPMKGTSRKVRTGEKVMDFSFASFIESDAYSPTPSTYEEDIDREYVMFFKHLREDAKSYVLEMARNDMTCMLVKYEDDNDLEDDLKHKCSNRLKDISSKEKVKLKRDWVNVTRVEKKDIPTASGNASTKGRKIPLVEKCMEEKSRKRARLSQKHGEHDPGVRYTPGRKHDLGSDTVSESYDYFLKSLKKVGDNFVLITGDAKYTYEEDDDCSSDPDPVIERAGNAAFRNKRTPHAPLISKIVHGKGSSSGTSSKFREKLIYTLRKPFDKEEYDKLLLKATRKKPNQGHKRLHSVKKSYPTKKNNKSYLELYTDLAEKIYSVRNNRPSVLNLLRSFFYWLQNSSQKEAFAPWLDEECLKLSGAFAKDVPSKDKVELKRDWENITRAEKRDIHLASRSASTKRRMIPVFNKDMEEKCTKTGRLSQKHGARYKPVIKHVVGEEDDDCSSDSDPVIELTCAPLISKTVLGKRSYGGTSSKFREKLMDILRKPFDREEYDKLLLEATRKKPIQGHTNLHNVEKSYPTKKNNKSYLELYTDLTEKIYSVHNNRSSVLNLLRGFFYWLQNSSEKGTFAPWLDEACLKLSGAFAIDIPRKDKVELERDWENITRVEKKDIPIASRSASTKQRKIPVVRKDTEETCRKSGTLSQNREKHDHGVCYKPKSKYVAGEEDDDDSSDSDSVIELTCASLTFKTVLAKGSSSGTSSKFREKLMDILGRPFNKEEYDKLLLEVNRQKLILGHKRLRSVEKSYPTKKKNQSYLGLYPDLAEKMYLVRNNRPSVLNLLRGFFYWLQNLAQEGAFVPWFDEACLKLVGVAGKHVTKIENVL